MMENLENLARAAYQLHADIDAKRKELKDIEAQIAAQAVFPEGRKTASTTVGNFSVKVQKTERYKWDPSKLSLARTTLGDAKFLKLFSYEWKAKKTALDGFLENAPEEQRKSIEDAMTVISGCSVSVEEKS